MNKRKRQLVKGAMKYIGSAAWFRMTLDEMIVETIRLGEVIQRSMKK